MGKLAIMSDLHVDINQIGGAELRQLLEVLAEQEITRLHLAGDTANDVSLLLKVVHHIENSGILVTYNFGNHELPSVATPAEMEVFPEKHFLNQDVIELNDNLVLLGVNGWYDYSFGAEKDEHKHLAAKNLYWYDRLIQRGQSDPEITAEILNKLATLLEQLREKNKKIIVATHFVPRAEFIVIQNGRYERWNQLNAFLGSQAMGQLLSRYPQVEQVVFGHTHRKFIDQEIEGILYNARPFGYFYEWSLTRDFVLSRGLMTHFNPMKVRGVLKDYQAEFLMYRQAHLKSEFKRSLTIIDY